MSNNLVDNSCVDLIDCLKSHLKAYPMCQYQDIYKFIFQNEFGPGHLITDYALAFNCLKEELNAVKASNEISLLEDIGNGYSRINLAKCKYYNIDISVILKMFLITAKNSSGNKESFDKKINFVNKNSQDFVFPFSEEEIIKFINDNSNNLVSHSLDYKENYNPAYRLISSHYEPLLPIIIKISELMNTNEKVVIAIDGRCAAGKSTVAKTLNDLFDGVIIRMDDFFLPFNLRSQDRLSEDGGNVHYERFKEEIYNGINSGSSFKYKKFDCSIMDFSEEIEVFPNKLYIIEGSYSARKDFISLYNLKIFVDINTQLQKERIMERNGLEMYDNFINKWVPLEEKYFNNCNIRSICDYIITFPK